MKRFIIFLSLCLSAGSANAALSITDIAGSWENEIANGTGTIDITNSPVANATDSARWGTSTGQGRSGYDFTTSMDINSVVLDTNFSLGLFEHINEPISGTSLDTIDYDYSFTVGNPMQLIESTIKFTHDETSNDAALCPGDIMGCDDFVSFVAADINQMISIDGVDFLFNLLGFSATGADGTFTSTFRSPEGGTNSIQLWATVTEQRVPAPATLALMGLGLIGLGFARRRKAQA